MAKYAKRIDIKDNVITSLADLKAGEEVIVRLDGKESKYVVNDDVPFGHKIAVRDIKKGEKVIKYGFEIGSASADISKGDWVHTHNVEDDYKCLDKNGKLLPGQ